GATTAKQQRNCRSHGSTRTLTGAILLVEWGRPQCAHARYGAPGPASGVPGLTLGDESCSSWGSCASGRSGAAAGVLPPVSGATNLCFGSGASAARAPSTGPYVRNATGSDYERWRSDSERSRAPAPVGRGRSAGVRLCAPLESFGSALLPHGLGSGGAGGLHGARRAGDPARAAAAAVDRRLFPRERTGRARRQAL